MIQFMLHNTGNQLEFSQIYYNCKVCTVPAQLWLHIKACVKVRCVTLVIVYQCLSLV